MVYVDTVADDNRSRAALRERSPRSAAGPIGVAGYDMGRSWPSPWPVPPISPGSGSKTGSSGQAAPGFERHGRHHDGFGHYDHGALKGRYLVLRQWLDGKTVQIAEQ